MPLPQPASPSTTPPLPPEVPLPDPEPVIPPLVAPSELPVDVPDPDEPVPEDVPEDVAPDADVPEPDCELLHPTERKDHAATKKTPRFTMSSFTKMSGTCRQAATNHAPRGEVIAADRDR
jgi:hypothetical protein